MGAVGESGNMSSAVPNGHPGRIRGRVRPSRWRHGWASARVRDAIWGSAVSTWPRRREREATKKRQAHAGSPGKGLIMQVKFREVSGPGSGREGMER